MTTPDCIYSNINGYTTDYFLETIEPVTWASLGVGCAMGLSGVGAAWYVVKLIAYLFKKCIIFNIFVGNIILTQDRGFAIIGSSLMGGSVKAPRIRSRNLVR